jgi:hypothetical protein
MWWITRRLSSVEDVREPGGWLSSEILSRGCPCRCFGSDRTPGVAPRGVFRSRTVSTTVAKWFVPIARGTVDKVYRFGPLRNA